MMDEPRATTRIAIIVALVGAAMVGLVIRLVVLHLGIGGQERAIVAKTRIFKQTLAVPRGHILEGSSSAGILSLSIGVQDIWADPSLLMASNRVGSTVSRLKSLLDFDVKEVTARLSKTNSQFAYVARLVPEQKADQVAKLKLPGVHTSVASIRSYPGNGMLCHVLGFVNSDGVGAAGIEQLMEQYLKGSPGMIEGRLDGRRREMVDRRIQEILPKDGSHVVLTIDQNLQYIAEKAVDAALERNRAKAAFVIIERIRTGEILAMVSRPGFDPNQYGEAGNPQKLNRAIGQVYEPGSTFKVSLIAAALNEGVVTPETVFDTENGRWLHMGKLLRDAHPYERLDVADILKKSSNIGAAKIAIRLGNEKMDQYLRAFNIGSKLGIDLPGEECGIYPRLAKWSPISSSRIAIGQGVSVTGLQMLGVLCAIANDGVVMKPYVIREVVAADGTVLLRRQPEALGRAIRADTAALMRSLLARVCEGGGTGVKAGMDGFRVAGKTGTAQKVINGHYSESEYMASFAGFLPMGKPEIGMIVVFDEPQPLHTGGAVSAPVFREIAEQAVRYLDIVSDETAPLRKDAPQAGNETF